MTDTLVYLPDSRSPPFLLTTYTVHFPHRWCNWKVSFPSQKGETRGGGGALLFCSWSLGRVELWRPLEILKRSPRADKGRVKR